MAFNRYINQDRPFPIRRFKRSELEKAICELEKRGYECVRAIQPEFKSRKSYRAKEHVVNGITKMTKQEYIGSYESLTYVAYMKKVQS